MIANEHEPRPQLTPIETLPVPRPTDPTPEAEFAAATERLRRRLREAEKQERAAYENYMRARDATDRIRRTLKVGPARNRAFFRVRWLPIVRVLASKKGPMSPAEIHSALLRRYGLAAGALVSTQRTLSRYTRSPAYFVRLEKGLYDLTDRALAAEASARQERNDPGDEDEGAAEQSGGEPRAVEEDQSGAPPGDGFDGR